MAIDLDELRSRFFGSIEDASRLLRLFDFLPHVYLYVKDEQGRFVAMNRALVRIRGGQREEEFLGKTDIELHPAAWGRRYRAEDRKVMDSGNEIRDQVWLVPDATGRLGTFVSSKIPLRGVDEKVVGIAGVMYRLDGEESSATPPHRLQAATDLIARRFDGPLEVSTLALEVGLSVSQLNRRFRETYQMSPSEYLQRVRVHEASRRLAESDRAIGEVALECGFYDQAHLTRTFRKWMDMTPTEFRRESNSPAP